MIHKGIHILFLCIAAIPWLWWQCSARILGKAKAFQGMSQCCSLFPGKFGEMVRAAFYRLSLTETSQRTCIAFLSVFSHPMARLGKHVSMGSHCNIGWACIEENTIIASQVCITSGKNQHSFEDIHRPIRLQEENYAPVHIGKNCWIGAGSIIMADIGEGCIIAAGSVVTKPIPPFSIAAGTPAKVLRSRLPEDSTPQGATNET